MTNKIKKKVLALLTEDEKDFRKQISDDKKLKKELLKKENKKAKK